MSLYAEYLLEHTKDSIIEVPEGFAMYRYINGNQVYVVEIYIRPFYRRSGIASKLCDQIIEEAKAKGCTEIIGTVNPTFKGAKNSLLWQFSYGMEMVSSGENYILTKKAI